MLRSLTGIIAFSISTGIILWQYTNNLKSIIPIKSILISSFVIVAGYLYWQVYTFYDITPIDIKNGDAFSAGGEAYTFDLQSKEVENGQYVDAFIAPNELEKAWDKVSSIELNEPDENGKTIRRCLLRYLTSKGLRKDRAGIEQLTPQDVQAIQHRIANYKYSHGKGYHVLIYRNIWEIYNYLNGNNPQGNPLSQRLLFWDIGYTIFIENWQYGVGTGDLQSAFDHKYTQLPMVIEDRYQLHTHNQFLTIGITFGVLGLVYFIIMLLSGFLIQPNARNYLLFPHL